MVILRWLVLLLAFLAAPALAEGRVALIVANAAYDKAPLANPTHDAALIGPVLEGMGFAVETVTDADFIAFSDAVDRFAARAKGADVALFYFAGHGFAVQADRRLGVQNYLMAVSADVTARDDRVLRRDGLPLDDIVAGLTEAAKVSLVFIDACRNDPRVRAVGGTGRGLTRLPDPGGANVFVGLSTRLGDVAEDGAAGEGSPFARAFALHMPTPGLRLDDAFAQVRVAVTAETAGAQRPEAGRDDLDAALVLVMSGAAPDLPSSPAPARPAPLADSPPPVDVCARAETAYAEAKDLNETEGWRAFLSAYPDCPPETGFARTRLARLEAPPAVATETNDDPPGAAPSTGETVVAVAPPEPAPPPALPIPPLGTLLRSLDGHGATASTPSPSVRTGRCSPAGPPTAR